LRGWGGTLWAGSAAGRATRQPAIDQRRAAAGCSYTPPDVSTGMTSRFHDIILACQFFVVFSFSIYYLSNLSVAAAMFLLYC